MSSNDKVWLVTGASKGLGLATVRAALHHGARVVTTSRDPASLAAEITAGDDRFLSLETLLTDERSIAETIQRVLEAYGRIDVLVNNAGYSILGAVEEISDAEARANFDINVFGVLNMIRAVLPVMRAQRSGHVINLSSISGSIGGATTGIYSATKAAVLLLSESLASEVAELGIRVTALCPGGFRTDFLDTGSSSRHPEASIEDYVSTHQVLENFSRLNGHQGGDPARAGQVMVMLTEMDDPPARLYIGTDALRGIEYKLQQVEQGVRQHEKISLCTGYRR